MPLIAVSFSGYNRFDLDKHVTRFLQDESIRKDDIVHINFHYYESDRCNLVYYRSMPIDEKELMGFHKKYTSNPITAGEDNKKRQIDTFNSEQIMGMQE